jgi:hypothetical protein
VTKDSNAPQGQVQKKEEDRAPFFPLVSVYNTMKNLRNKFAKELYKFLRISEGRQDSRGIKVRPRGRRDEGLTFKFVSGF